jgi:hypothetical protein
VPADDHRLRESPDVNSPPLPPFRHIQQRVRPQRLNIFLVILNAGIKFRRYLQMSTQNPYLSLPADVLHLMHRTLQLVDLLYWVPTVPTKGSQGEKIMADTIRRRNSGREKRRGPSVLVKREFGEEMVPGDDGQGDMQADQDIKIPPASLVGRRKRRRWLAGVDLETRKAYGRALMSGHGMILSFLCCPQTVYADSGLA